MLFYVVFAAFVGNAFGAMICQEGWTHYEAENTCMKTFKPNTFRDAQANCQAEGGHLVVIHNGVKNKFAVDMMETQENFWIGVWDEHKKKHWTYVDGNALVYKNWHCGEPNNAGLREACAMVYNRPDAGEARGNWYDMPCGYKLASVCEKDSVLACQTTKTATTTTSPPKTTTTTTTTPPPTTTTTTTTAPPPTTTTTTTTTPPPTNTTTSTTTTPLPTTTITTTTNTEKVLPTGSKTTCEWIVTVSTGFEPNADTNDEVHIQLFGNGVSTSYYRLDTKYDDFEWGKTDVFKIKSFCQRPDKIRMKIGGQNSWYLMLVELQREDDMNTKYVFPCHCWLDDGGDKYVDVLTPGFQATCDWLVQVTTSNRKNSDTGNLVRMSIIGDDILHTTSHHVLKTKSGRFELGATDEIRFKSKCLTPKAIKLKLEGTDGWRADKVVLQRMNYDKDKNKYIFNCNCLLDNNGFRYISL